MKKKGFTLVELLVVIAIIALLMGILMPALARVRQIAFRMHCGTNLSGIGKAMLIYANDYDDELPKSGWPSSTLQRTIENWLGESRTDAFGAPPDGPANITSCFYALVKFADVTAKSFICKSDSIVKEFKLSDEGITAPDIELIDVWDFGYDNSDNDSPDHHCSYSYHHPFGHSYALTTSGDPGMAVAADRNPWIPPPTNGNVDDDWNDFDNSFSPPDTEDQKLGNAVAHQGEGQNVLFLDAHVTFEKYSFCAVDDDNIYTRATYGGRQRGLRRFDAPFDRKDSLLISNRALDSGVSQ